MLLSVSWLDGHLSAILAALAGKGSKKLGLRRSVQYFRSFLHYGTKHFWQTMLSSTTSPNVKLELVVKFTIGLGLRCPSEPASKLLASLWMCCSQTEVEKLTRIQKGSLYATLKKEFDYARRRAPEPVLFIEQLPKSPLLCLRNHELLYRSFYVGDSEPVEARVNIEALMDFDNSYSCRGGVPKHSNCAAERTQQTTNIDPMERLARFCMETQERMMESLFQPQRRAPLPNLRILEPRRRLPNVTTDADTEGQPPRLSIGQFGGALL